MAEIEVPVLEGEIRITLTPDGETYVFELENQNGPVRFAVRGANIAALIWAAASAFRQTLPTIGTGPGPALPTTGWSVYAADENSLAFSFELSPGAVLTFVLPRLAGPAVIDSLKAALGLSDLTGVPNKNEQN